MRVLTNSTVSGNSTAGADADGGGISVLSAGRFYTYNSIVAGNTARRALAPRHRWASVYSNGANIFGSEVDGSTPKRPPD